MKKIICRMFVIVALCSISFVLCSCRASDQRAYYKEKTNYITVKGTVSHIKYNEAADALYLGFSELSPKLDDSNFKIIGNNLRIAQENGIDHCIELGEQIEFVTAPRYFGDGYVMPIVAISVGGKTLLPFEDGYTNLVNEIDGMDK